MALRFPDRRYGFDRRVADASSRTELLAWYRDNEFAVLAVLGLVLFFNLADAVLTLRALDRGAAELNPLMSLLIGVDPALAASVKIVATAVAVGMIWMLRRYRAALVGSLLLAGVFSALMVYHAAGLVLFAR